MQLLFLFKQGARIFKYTPRASYVPTHTVYIIHTAKNHVCTHSATILLCSAALELHGCTKQG